MKNPNQKSIDTLNNLLEINNDRIAGYEHAYKETNENDLKDIFAHLAITSRECRDRLTAEIKKLGGTPVEGTRTTGKLYRAWMDIRAALTGKDRKAILKSCEFGEDVAVKNYEEAFRDDSLGADLYALINNQHALIKADHDKVKKLRDALVSTEA